MRERRRVGGGSPADFRTKRPQSGATARRVLDLFSDFCSWEFDICCFPALSPGSFPDLAPSLEQGSFRYMSITVFVLVVPYVALLLFSACSSNLPTGIWKKKGSKVSCQSGNTNPALYREDCLINWAVVEGKMMQMFALKGHLSQYHAVNTVRASPKF